MNWKIQHVLALIAIVIAIVINSQRITLPLVVNSVMTFLQETTSYNTLEPKDRLNLLNEYDFIIVGAGTAGCVIANRLTENPNWKVLLLEAGRTENYLMDIPILANYLQLVETDWKYKTQPSKKACLGHTGRRCNWPRGKVMGGSSVLNYMIYTRGNRRDYDNWARLGNPGWSYEDILPYFKKVENFNIDDFYDPKYHSKSGYLSVSYPPWHTKLAEAFVQAGMSLGYPYVDYDGPTQIGVSYLHTSLKNGSRHSSNRAYLHPISRRPNLHVSKYSMVTKILIDEQTKEARGVQFLKNGLLHKVYASKEVILTAGAINSPHLLMISGIGPKDHLQQFNIKVLSDLKVGYNLQDHWALGGLTFLVNQSVSLRTERLISEPGILLDYLSYHNGPLSVPGGCEAIMFIDLKNPRDMDGYPELEILFQGGSLVSNELLKRDFGISDELYEAVYRPIQNRDAWMAFPMILLPKSRGRIMLSSNDPLRKPLIYPNYFSHPDDIEIIVAGTKKIIELSQTPAFQRYGTRLHDIPIPTCRQYPFGSDDYWRCHARHITFTIYHHVGTCRMGPDSDPTAVVNPRLKVRGIKRLRVIDASIMPEVPAAHTNAPVYMIAEKGADLVKQDWGYPI